MSNFEKQERVKYIRLLEKFTKSIVNSLKKPDFDKEKLLLTISQKRKLFDKVEPQVLNTEYFKELEAFVNMCFKNDVDEKELLSKANFLDKLKNQKHKKDKHKKRYKEDY